MVSRVVDLAHLEKNISYLLYSVLEDIPHLSIDIIYLIRVSSLVEVNFWFLGQDLYYIV